MDGQESSGGTELGETDERFQVTESTAGEDLVIRITLKMEKRWEDALSMYILILNSLITASLFSKIPSKPSLRQ